jgi:predicted nucleic acid-binding Zn finger protein
MSTEESAEERDFFECLRENPVLTLDTKEKILRIFGERGRKALLAVEESRVKKYLDFFVVVGTHDEYVVDDEFCNCRAQQYRKGHCWHVLAARIAEVTGLFETVDEWYQDVWKEG